MISGIIYFLYTCVFCLRAWSSFAGVLQVANNTPGPDWLKDLSICLLYFPGVYKTNGVF